MARGTGIGVWGGLGMGRVSSGGRVEGRAGQGRAGVRAG